MKAWNSSPHPISDIRDWQAAGRLELRPDFQRRAVWSDAARIMLIDTILRDIPMPKVFVQKIIRDGSTYRSVVDGQQRLNAILSFLSNEFCLTIPYDGPYQNKRFGDLPTDVQDNILAYQIDFNEAQGLNDAQIREVYSRVNKYTFALNKQELRKADFPGDFLRLSEKLSLHPYLEKIRLFLPNQRRRYLDVEYASELLAAQLEGIQDTKTSLDDFYQRYAVIPPDEQHEAIQVFSTILSDMERIFSATRQTQDRTRFRQKADFYALFVSIAEARKASSDGLGDELTPLGEDLDLLDYHVRPESDVPLLSEYAIKCVSQANSAASRAFRRTVLQSILVGTYARRPPDETGTAIFYRIYEEAMVADAGYCPMPTVYCPIRGIEFELSDPKKYLLAWAPGTEVFQMSNSTWLEPSVVDRADGWTIIERPAGYDRIPL